MNPLRLALGLFVVFGLFHWLATAWAPALLHFVIQGAPKIIVLPGDPAFLLLVWMVASAVVPMLVFAVRGRLQAVTPLA